MPANYVIDSNGGGSEAIYAKNFQQVQKHYTTSHTMDIPTGTGGSGVVAGMKNYGGVMAPALMSGQAAGGSLPPIAINGAVNNHGSAAPKSIYDSGKLLKNGSLVGQKKRKKYRLNYGQVS